MTKFSVWLLLSLTGLLAAACSKESGAVHVLDPDTQLTLLEGFDAELLYSVPESQGSWVAMAFDAKGRLLVSDQDDKGVFRVTLPPAHAPVGETAVEVESLTGFPHVPVAWGRRTVAGALGFLFAFDSLYMSSMKGFYRIRDTDGDDQFDEFTLLKELSPGWEHSAHTILETEDGKGLYLVSGNHSSLPAGVHTRQPAVWREDSLLPSMVDPSGHARGIQPPGGWICRVSPDGQDWQMVASGFRNAVDLAINRAGELFTADSDLEFDVGSPWYRPTRVNHVTSASEFGWRAGSAKWPEYFADSNGSVVDLGPGSPTGISFGHHSNFPPLYQDQLFVCDWTFGTIYTVALTESGSSYVGVKQEFLHGAPLNISAMRFGPDGHMYFLVGGRNTASKLYRVRYTGAAAAAPTAPQRANQELRDQRHALEQLQREGVGQRAIDAAWPYLGHVDRNLRYAARLAIECQRLELWRERAFAESQPRAAIQALIAISRHGDASLSSRAMQKLLTLPFGTLARDDRLALLRACSLVLSRLGPTDATQCSQLAASLEPFYPCRDEALDAELARLLCYLEAPSVVAKTIALMQATQTKVMAYDEQLLTRHEYGQSILKAMANTPNSQNIHYAYCLRRVQSGWSLASRRYYFSWLKDTLEKSGGQSFAGYVRGIREDAIDHLPAEEVAGVASLLAEIAPLDLASLPEPKGPPEAWMTDTVMALFENGLHGRDFANGETMFAAGKCIACHRFQGSGGLCGPDLGAIGNRFAIRDIVVAICEPSHTISEQYQASIVTRKDGSTVFGRIIYQDATEIAVASNPYDFGELTRTPSDQVQKVELSQVSQMPPSTITMMSRDEIADLMAYLVSGGDKRHAVFRER